MFRRRNRADRLDEGEPTVDGLSDVELDDPVLEDPALGDPALGDPAPQDAAVHDAAVQGPWDAADLPDDDIPRLDLGGMQVPVPEGLEVRVDVQDEVVVAATLVDGASAMQLHAFAAPRTSGLWAQVREEIAESLQQGPGSAATVDGPFGPELAARIPDDTGTTPARFVGVDGPRWFLRGLLTGPAATDSGQAVKLESVFRQVVVVRGHDAMAPRDMLPLRLPREALESAAASAESSTTGTPATGVPTDEPPTLDLPERGPEITEIQ